LRFLFAILIASLAVHLSCSLRGTGPRQYDVVVYGATPGGVSAAVASARMGDRVCLIATGPQVGGMMASGLGNSDAGDPDFIGGISAEVFARIADHYLKTYGENSSQWEQCHLGFRFEPHVAEEVFEALLAEENVQLLRGWRLTELELSLNKINSITLWNDNSDEQCSVEGRFFIDATYTGDLFTEAGCPFALGRESREDYGESMAGHIYQDPRTRLSLPGSRHQADSLIQAYNYRLCLTDSAGNSVSWPEPENYDPDNYQLLLEYIRSRGEVSPADFMIFSPLPNRKYDLNNWGYCWLSTDLIGGAQGYPQGTPEQRRQIEIAHREHILGLWKFLRTDPRVPEKLRQEFARYALAADEFTETGNWPFQLYVREARRLHGAEIFSQRDATTDTLKAESIGMGSYPLDSHATGEVLERYPWREGFFILPARPYKIPYRIMVPTWVRNLLSPVCVSATHVGLGTIRMEPVWMILGQAAGVAASACLEFNCNAVECPITVLQERLREQGQVLAHDQARPWADYLAGSSR
jgi:hypothetical protein